MLESFVKVYEDRPYRFPTAINHGGMVVAFAMDDHRRIRYAALAPKPDDPLDVDGWPADPAVVPFPRELVPVGFAAADPTPMPMVAVGTTTPAPAGTVLAPDDLDPVLSTTARLGAAAPFQVVSDGQFLYVFRQSVTEPTPEQLTLAITAAATATDPADRAAAQDVLTDHSSMVYVTDPAGAPTLDADGVPIPLVSGRILVDRFVLVGDRLQPKREVRFQRSRNRTRPATRTDGLGDKDLDGRPFVEPTQELRFLPPADRGRFAVGLVPTSVAGSYRWQLVCADQGAAVLWSYSVEQASDGLFDTLGGQGWTCADHPDVFALLGGTCTRAVGSPPVPCGKPLVPVVEQAGSAGSAVELTAGSAVRLRGAAELGTRFTVEAWVKVAADGPDGEQVLLGGGPDDPHSSPTVRIVDRTGVRVGFGDGTALRTVTAAGALVPGTWQHLAASYDGTLVTVCVCGRPVLTSTDLAGATPVGTAPASVGSPTRGFEGIVDEVRLWNLARSVEEIRARLHLRQSGLEEGLVGYWRFDEGRGMTVWDHAGTATGQVDGARWVTSDAPIGLSRGVSRTTVRIAGRVPTDGVSVAVYFQQENAAGGYDVATPKRHKGAARVMVAAVTSPAEAVADPDAGRVTVLDFGLGPDGRLSDLPTTVELPSVTGPSAGGQSLAQLLDEIGTVEATQAALGSEIRSAGQLIADLTDGLAKAHRAQSGQLGADIITGACADLQPTAFTVNQLATFIGALARQLPPPGTPADPGMLAQLTTWQAQLQAPLVQLDAGITAHQTQLNQAQTGLTKLQRDLVAAQTRLATLRTQANGDVAAPMPLLHVDADGGTVAGAVLEFATARSAPQLFDSALGTLGLYFRGGGDQLSGAYYDTFTGRARFRVPGASRAVTFVPYSAMGELDQLTVTVSAGADDAHCDLSVTLPGPNGAITETWHALPRDPEAFAAILAGTAQPPGQKDPYDYAANATTTLPGAVLTGGSRLVAVDVRGATGVDVGTATLLSTSPSARWFGSLPGTTLLFDGARTDAGLLTTTAVHLDGVHDGLTLGNPGRLDITGQITLEAWVRATAHDGLRDIVTRGYTLTPPGEVVLRIRDGHYEVGSWDGAGHKVSCPIPAGDLGSWVHLAGTYDGVRWILYRNGVLAGSADEATGAVPVNAGWSVGVSAAGDRRFAGDLDDVRIWSGTRSAVEIADAKDGRLGGTEKALAGYWFASGGVFSDHTTGHQDGTFQSAPQVVASPAALTQGDFDVVGDVTVEAWVNPEPGAGVARLVAHRSNTSSYLLGLRAVPSALVFNGSDQLVRVRGLDGLNLHGPLSVEAWVLPTTVSSQLRYVVARGLDAARTAEICLRVVGEQYQFGCFDGKDHFAVSGPTVKVSDDYNRWVHLAGVYDGTSWRVYRNGAQVGELLDATQASVPTTAGWAIGGSFDGSRLFTGRIGEVRVWTVARTAQQLADSARAPRWATGTEPDLALCVRYDGQSLIDVTPARRTLDVAGTPTPTPVDGFGGAYRVVAGTGPQYVESSAPFPGHDWTHLALAFEQDYAVHLAQNGYLDAGSKDALNLTSDLTLEVAVTFDDLAAPHGLLTLGRSTGAAADRVPYALRVEANGTLVFAFVDADGTPQPLTTDAGAVQMTSRLYRIGVVRKVNAAPDPQHPTTVDRWTDVTFVVDGTVVKKQTYRGQDAGSGTGPLHLGRVYGADGAVVPLRGSLTEVRLWRKALDPGAVGARIDGSEKGLVAWWRLAEGTGTVTADVKGTATATLRGAVSWVKTPDPTGSALQVYRDGVPVVTTPVSAATYAPTADGFALGGTGTDRFTGQLEELRVWRTRRTTEQLQDNMFRRIEGEQRDLVAYYTFDGEPGTRLTDQGPRGNTLQVVGGTYQPSTAPVGADAPQVRNAVAGLTNLYTARVAGAPGVAEYADLQSMTDGSALGVYKRCYGLVDDAGRWQLVTGYKVGDLSVEWVGQAQFDPQLAGFIEGTPPVPSENLTVNADGYGGASSVAITEAATTKYTYASSRKAGIDASFEAKATTSAKTKTYEGLALGVIEIEAPLGVGLGETELDVNLFEIEQSSSGFTVSLSTEVSTSWLASSESGQGTTLTRASSMELTGHPETTPQNTDIGARWVPENQGMALVRSQTADVFALRLRATGALVAYQMRANPDIPVDWNILIFPINPRYTKQGVLDGKVGLRADVDYPAGLHLSSDASYFKPIEAYQLKARIDREEQELATYFAQFDAGVTGVSADTASKVPTGTKRNVVNTYVWTAAGGFFAETRDLLDSRAESTGGSFEFKASVGGGFTSEFTLFGIGFDLDLSAKRGAHLELEVSKRSDTDANFDVAVAVTPERDITHVDEHGRHVPQPGKVDAYRFMTYYLAPSGDHHDLFFQQVVDPMWLEQSADPAAVALRGARQPAQRPACWRVLHRVTYVSRILEPVSPQPDAFTQALRALDLNSNYEMVRTLAPYVASRTASLGDFVLAVRQAVQRRLPDLLGHLDQVTEYLAGYYGLEWTS